MPAFVRVTEGTSTTTTLTLNINVSTGTNRVLVFGVAYKSNSVLTETSIDFNTSETFSLERRATDGVDAQCSLWYLANPTVTTADAVLVMPSSVRMVGYVAYFTDCDQTNPFTASTTEAQGSDAAPTVSLTSDAAEIALDIMAQVSAGPNTATLSHTLLANGAATGGGTDTRGAGQYSDPGANPITMDYSMSGSDHWNIIAASLQAPVAITDAIQDIIGGTGIIPFAR
jgi:hypothetical protein